MGKETPKTTTGEFAGRIIDSIVLPAVHSWVITPGQIEPMHYNNRYI